MPLDSDFAAALLEITRKRMGMVAIVDDDRRVQGIFTDGDLRRVLGARRLAGSWASLKIRDVMTASPITIAPRRTGRRGGADHGGAQDRPDPGGRTPDKVLLGALHFHDLLVAKVV